MGRRGYIENQQYFHIYGKYIQINMKSDVIAVDWQGSTEWEELDWERLTI